MEYYEATYPVLKEYLDLYMKLLQNFPEIDYYVYLMDTTTTTNNPNTLSQLTKDFESLSKKEFLNTYSDSYVWKMSYEDYPNMTMEDVYNDAVRIKQNREKVIKRLREIEKFIVNSLKGD